MRILLKNARIIKMDDTPIFYGDILVNGNRIEKVAENIETEEKPYQQELFESNESKKRLYQYINERNNNINIDQQYTLLSHQLLL